VHLAEQLGLGDVPRAGAFGVQGDAGRVVGSGAFLVVQQDAAAAVDPQRGEARFGAEALRGLGGARVAQVVVFGGHPPAVPGGLQQRLVPGEVAEQAHRPRHRHEGKLDPVPAVAVVVDARRDPVQVA
jgi:hypothetical protein